MRRIFPPLLCLAAGVISACTPDEIIPTENIPTAGVRFINAVPDTIGFDFRFVDQVESNAHFRITFRNSPITVGAGALAVTGSTSIQYKNARAGARHFRIFLNDTLAVNASIVVKDSTVTLVAGSNYTVLLSGYMQPTGPNRPAGAPALKLSFFEEKVANPAPNVALRVMNFTNSAIDARQYAWNLAAPVAATWTVAANDTSAYVNVLPDTLLFNVRPAGGAAATLLFADQRALFGEQATVVAPGPFDATPGTTVAGSAVTAMVFPGVVACSGAPQTSTFQTTTGFVRTLSVTATGYARSAGSFVTDGFAVGQSVGACNFSTAANNGLSTVTAVAALALTVTKTGGTAVEAATTGTTGATAALTATATGYARSAGDFVADGFVVGMLVTAAGFTNPLNNGVSLVTAVTATALTVTKLPITSVEAGTTGSTTIAADTVGGTGYVRSAGSFITDGFLVGHAITTTGFVSAANNGGSVVTAMTATKLTVSKAGGTVVEAAGAGRTISTSATRTILINRMIAAPKPAISFMWDRRPPRP